MGVKLDVEAKACVEALADRYGLSISEVLRRCVASGLPRLEAAQRKTKDGVL